LYRQKIHDGFSVINIMSCSCDSDNA